MRAGGRGNRVFSLDVRFCFHCGVASLEGVCSQMAAGTQGSILQCPQTADSSGLGLAAEGSPQGTACEPPSYRRGAKYMLNDTSLKVIKQLLDNYGRPIWCPA
jgi:hypothetical protein